MTTTSDGPAQDQPQRRGLLDLPPELWSKIGKMIIDDLQPMTEARLVKQSKAVRFKRKYGRQQAWQPRITRVCRKLRDELLPYYYRTKMRITNKAWQASDPNSSDIEQACDTIGKWLRAIGPGNRMAIAGITCTWSLSDPRDSYSTQQACKDLEKIWHIKCDMVGEVQRMLGKTELGTDFYRYTASLVLLE